jgi:hypothetical protein
MSAQQLRERVVAALEKLGVPHVHGTDVPAPAGGAVIVSAPAALRAYDSVHPERIACIVTKPDDNTFFVVVRNRELCVERALAFWWTGGVRLHDALTCVVCHACLHVGLGRSSIHVCDGCHSTVCDACNERMNLMPARFVISLQACRKKPVMFSAVSSFTLLTTASSTPRGHGHACRNLPLTLVVVPTIGTIIRQQRHQ